MFSLYPPKEVDWSTLTTKTVQDIVLYSPQSVSFLVKIAYISKKINLHGKKQDT